MFREKILSKTKNCIFQDFSFFVSFNVFHVHISLLIKKDKMTHSL